MRAPRPWGVTTVFAEFTGHHPALEIDWTVDRRVPFRPSIPEIESGVPDLEDEVAEAALASQATSHDEAAAVPAAQLPVPVEPPPPSFSTFWEFAVAVNRSDPAALKLAANGADSDIPMDPRELRKLLGTFWFRSVFPRLSAAWRERVLNVLVEHSTIADHAFRVGRRTVHLHELTREQRQQLLSDTSLTEGVRADLQLLVTVAMLWGEPGVGRFELIPVPEPPDTSTLGMLLQPFRHS
jgi:hypothetical protein